MKKWNVHLVVESETDLETLEAENSETDFFEFILEKCIIRSLVIEEGPKRKED